ncbi:hybrid sensor histidine kinase/response regulator transcription factor [Fulvivirga sediminis]|uniref:histidine kinase n=1 Tax=Fulvivirga sediminis TaxID=2803949 RepID=A0A937JXY2_9BACT|nr:hybrid sensor histidine kinase/response regulator transcription factor [Fulvivirga sediminis]MBL3655913.1 response regulator [Fulvivirga sediminis]
MAVILSLSWSGMAQEMKPDLKFVHYSSQEGLPSSYVKDIVEDKYGFIWLANRENVCRFDGYNFKTFPAYNEQGAEFKLRTNALLITSDSVVLCKAMDNSYYYFSQKDEVFKPYNNFNRLGVFDEVIPAVDGGFWVLKDQRVFHLKEKAQELAELSHYYPDLDMSKISATRVVAKGGKLAIAGDHSDIVIAEKGGVSYYNLPFGNNIAAFYFDNYNNLWVGCHQNGLCRIDLDTHSLEFFSSNAEDGLHLPHNMVHCLQEDAQGRLWMGTEGGLCLWTPEKQIFAYYKHDLKESEGLSSNPIYTAFRDRSDNIWLGTYFSGVNLWNKGSNFFNMLPSGICDRCLRGNAVSSLTEDCHGNIWIGLEDIGLNVLNKRTGLIKNYPIENGTHQGLSYGNIHDLYFADKNELWIATYTGGINILNTETGHFEYINTSNSTLMANNIYALEGKGDSIFIATSNGVNIYKRSTAELQPFFPDIFQGMMVESITLTNEHVWFSTREAIYSYSFRKNKVKKLNKIDLHGINFVKSDSRGRLWVGDSFSGLYCYTEQNDEVYSFNEHHNGFGNWFYGLQEGDNDHIWASTDEGLVRFNLIDSTSTAFNNDSGVPFSQFNYRAAFKDSDGIIYFGSNQGLIYFDESKSDLLNECPGKVAFTGFALFNESVFPGKEASPLNESINLTEKIELDYEQNVFTLEFSVKNYGNKGRGHYAYYLEGFENGYNYAGSRNFASYTNLSPGEYTFKVKASLNNVNWDSPVTEMKIVVKPPFWMSGWGYTLFAFAIIMVLVMIYWVGARIQKSKTMVEVERKEHMHAVELNKIKLEFFTNVSHELRTPLTLIIGPLSKLLSDAKVSPSVKERLSAIDLNARRLLKLLNQLLEFRKIESGTMALKVSKARINDLMENLEQSFINTAKENQIALSFDCSKANQEIWFDQSKVEKVLINLISNAFKFTDHNGAIAVRAEVKDTQLILSVEDTGKGMEQHVVNRIFEAFYQAEREDVGVKKYYGSGIGLAFVHSLVELHKGSIQVKSTPNVGTVFIVQIPIDMESYSQNEIRSSEYVPNLVPGSLIVSSPIIEETSAEQQSENDKRPTILVVEDNSELIEFISRTLSEHYQVLKAGNGAEGLKVLEEEQVDLILSDVMMPLMDGLEFTSKVKGNIETSHIPVMLLTAKGGPENMFEGMKTGADYYIEKPFMAHILEYNIFNALNTRRNLIKRFKSDALMPVAELTHSDADKEFLNKLTAIIKENIDKPSLDVGFLMNEIGLSRSMLHIKLKKITDNSATEFINMVRLKEALKLMVDSGCNVSEAAYRTGFSSPTYFSRRFKQYYGQTPRDFLQKEPS